MSAYGYFRTFHGVRQSVRSYPESRRSRANVRFRADFVRFTSRSGLSWWCRRRTGFDPIRKLMVLGVCKVSCPTGWSRSSEWATQLRTTRRRVGLAVAPTLSPSDLVRPADRQGIGLLRRSDNGTGVSGVPPDRRYRSPPYPSEIKSRAASQNPTPPCTLVDDLTRLKHHQPNRRTSHGESPLKKTTRRR